MSTEREENLKRLADQLNEEWSNHSPEKIISYFLEHFAGRIALASSLGQEDQVLTDMIAKIDPQTPVFTLDTGRLFPESYRLIDRTNRKYGISVKVYFPEASQVEELVHKSGVNCFYDTIELRRECCRVRKIEPLKRAFQGLDIWICGLRRDQSVTRQEVRVVEWDAKFGLIKLNPLLYWSEEELQEYIKTHRIPYNPLHDKGFPSIGCQPCTRAIAPGEDIRAGRWWWENPEHKECGLHR
ncbi:MAG: phosphoadenylyl-sulfate reductase [Bacteroides sp.]|nr:phosphoadenylyl-sulfate reductase [Bacteroides sp.]